MSRRTDDKVKWLYLEARIRPTAQTGLNEAVKTIGRLICRGDEVVPVKDKIVFASIEGLPIIDPGVDVFVIASCRACESSQLAIFKKNVI